MRHATKTHDEIFGEMVTALGEAISIARGEADPATYRVHAPDIDVRAVRKKTGLSQNAFAGAFGFSAGTVRDWEQKRRRPDQSARMYLWVIGREPELVRKALDPLIPKGKTITGSFGHRGAVPGKNVSSSRREATTAAKKRRTAAAH
jgi:putative transcriptional regulator